MNYYRIFETRICNHAAIKLCNPWFEKSIRGIDSCFKAKFYGIISHQCFQLSTCLLCNQNCIYCWAPTERIKEIPKWKDSSYIVVSALTMYKELVFHYINQIMQRGSQVSKKALKEAIQPRHVAISLYGESTLYPYLPEVISKLRAYGLTVFLTTNGTRPEMIKKVTPTQLTLSLNAPTEELYNKICRPRRKNLWSKINKTIDILGTLNVRTVIRIMLMKNLNLNMVEDYAELIKRGSPNFIEIKCYEHIGKAKERLVQDIKPSYAEILHFAKKLSLALNRRYRIIDRVRSQSALLMSNGSRNPRIG